MKIIVLAKVIEGELNLFDQSALECALSVENSEVTVISMGPVSSKEKLKSLTRLGVDRVILISDGLYAGSDTLATSYILSEAIKRLEYDAIFCGRQTTDGDTAQVGSCTATMLGVNLCAYVMQFNKISINDISCKTRMSEELINLPALFTIERICNLRFPSIRSKESDIEIWDNNMLNLDVKRCGLNGSPTKVLKVFEKKNDVRKCKYIKNEKLTDLIDSLIEKEDKSTQVKPINNIKLDIVWVIGKKAVSEAKKIARNIVVIENDDPYEIAKLAKEQKPNVILWNSDLWGRKNAPIVQAMLNTGLCADCTKLETDGKTLYMYRPAKSGNVTAKIKCDTLPQMATVRTVTKSDDIIVSCGKGTIKYLDKIKGFAKDIGATLCASRGLVDTGIVPYEMQVGLTGKNVAPKIYIAIGISGAIHHTVGIENAQYIIAINKDKDSRIFEYSDYGIIGDLKTIFNKG